MHFLSFIFLQLFTASCADNTGIIRDYFAFKNVTRVAGFSCGEIAMNGEMIKTLNNAGIAASIKQVQSVNNTARFLHTRYTNLGIFLDLQCPFADEDIVNLFHEASASRMFDHLHQWLILGRNINRIVPLINDETFSIITDVAFAVRKNDDYVLYDVYNHCKHCGGLINITALGVWTKDNGLKITLCLNKFSRRWNYHKMNVKMAGIVTAKPPNYSLVQYLREKNNDRTDHWSKFGYSILIHISDMFNITFQMTELNYWAKNDSNGPLMSGLNRSLFDIGFFPSIITSERLDLAGVMLQVFPVRTCFMFLTVPSLKTDINIIVRPFARNVWYMIILLIVVIIFVLWTILKVEKDVVNSDYGSTVLIIFAAMCQQGLPFFSNQFASRIAFLQAMIFGLLVYNCYSAAVVSSRLNAPLNKMNDSLHSLLRSKMTLAAYKNIYFDVLLRSPVDEVRRLKKHWETIPEEKRFCSMEEGIRKIMKPGFAYHADTNAAYPLIERIFTKQMICQLTEVHLLRLTSLGLWSARHSQFREITKIGLIRISTAGIVRREQLRWGYRKPYCNQDKHYVSSVTIEETMPIAIILLSGIILSAAICFMENIVFHLLQTKPWRKKTLANRLAAAENKAAIKAKMFAIK